MPATRRLNLAEQLAAARRDETLAEIVQRSTWDRYVVMQVVLLHGATHDTWSANDIRHLLPEQGRGFLGAAISGLRSAGYITQPPMPGVPSTLPRTKGHRLAVWMLTAKGHRESARRFQQTADVA
jgi:hypothetical protein